MVHHIAITFTHLTMLNHPLKHCVCVCGRKTLSLSSLAKWSTYMCLPNFALATQRTNNKRCASSFNCTVSISQRLQRNIKFVSNSRDYRSNETKTRNYRMEKLHHCRTLNGMNSWTLAIEFNKKKTSTNPLKNDWVKQHITSPSSSSTEKT